MQDPACYFCASKTQQLLADEAAMLLHASQGHSSICSCSCRRRGLSSLEKGPQEPAEQQEPAVQWMGEMGADLPYLQAAHTVAAKAHQPQAGAMGSLLALLGRCQTGHM